MNKSKTGEGKSQFKYIIQMVSIVKSLRYIKMNSPAKYIHSLYDDSFNNFSAIID